MKGVEVWRIRSRPPGTDTLTSGDPEKASPTAGLLATDWRLYDCRWCDAAVAACRKCDHGSPYCSRDCSRLGRKASVREAGRRYQQTPNGRENHNERCRTSRIRQPALYSGAPSATVTSTPPARSRYPRWMPVSLKTLPRRPLPTRSGPGVISAIRHCTASPQAGWDAGVGRRSKLSACPCKPADSHGPTTPLVRG
jgi:hypothetical protein